jgi:hypothetical protein
MNALVPVKNIVGAETVRYSDNDLHRAARKGLHEGNHVVFRLLPVTIGQIIQHKVWKTRSKPFKNFGEYALDQTSDGLGIDNNQLLWLLRCSLDIDGAHMREWASVLEEVERAVKAIAKAEGLKIRDFNSNSLETLGKISVGQHTSSRITYLPSGNRNVDGNLVRLRRAAPETYRKVLAGQISIREGVRQAGMQRKDSDVHRDPVDRAIMYVKRMAKPDIKRLVEWMVRQGYVKG